MRDARADARVTTRGERASRRAPEPTRLLPRTPRFFLISLCVFVLTSAACVMHDNPSPFDRARAAAENQDYTAAAASYEEFLAGAQRGPEAETALFRLADIYYLKLKRYEDARDHYTAFLDQYPESGYAYDARRRLAEVNVDLQDPLEAITQYERLVEEHPDTGEWRKIRVAIGDLYFDLKDFSQAEVEYTRVVEGAEYDETTERSLLRLASIYHMVRNQHENALALYERVAASTPDPTVRRQALYGLSEGFAELFRFEEAIVALKRIEDPTEAQYVARRTAELERRKREHTGAPEIDWSRRKGEG